jgi:hypothetical protein
VKRCQAGKTVDSRLGAKLAPASIEDAGLEPHLRHEPIYIAPHSINHIDEFLLWNLAVQFFGKRLPLTAHHSSVAGNEGAPTQRLRKFAALF